MSQRGSRVSSRAGSPIKSPLQTYQHSYVTMDSNINPNSYSTYSIPNKQQYSGSSVNTYQRSRLASSDTGRLAGSQLQEGAIRGQSRIQYVPYEKKVIEYQTRTYTEKVPRTRKVVDYQERKVFQTVPREVIKQDYYAVEKITQYYKETIPEKTIQIVPVQRKVKRIQYVPVEKQIVHYPQNQDFRTIRGQSRVVLESQGVYVKPDAQFRPIESDLLYKYTTTTVNPNLPVGYVDLGQRRYLSTAPTHVNSNLGFSNVQRVGGQSFISGSRAGQPLQFQQSQVYNNYASQQPTFINRINDQNFSNVLSGSKYDYRYGDVGYLSPRNYQ